MAGIKVHGPLFSSSVQRVLLCLTEKELEYDTVHVDLSTNQQKKEPFISLNPFGQVPGLEDGNLKLFESRAITRYIAHAYADKGTPLIFHDDPMKMAIVSTWMEVESLKFNDAGQKLNFEILIKPTKGIPTNETLAEQLQSQLVAVLDVYEARLSESEYLAGDCFTLSDLHHVPIINSLMKTKAKTLFEERPHVRAWCACLLARPAWQKVLASIKSH